MVAMRLLLLLSLSGCSFIFTSGPPPQHEKLDYFECSTNRFPPVWDTVAAIVDTAAALVAVSDSGDITLSAEERSGASSAAALFALGGLIDVSSAYYGYSRTSSCSDAKAEMRARAASHKRIEEWRPTGGGCAKDTDCKGDRVCSPTGQCVGPAPSAGEPIR